MQSFSSFSFFWLIINKLSSHSLGKHRHEGNQRLILTTVQNSAKINSVLIHEGLITSHFSVSFRILIRYHPSHKISSYTALEFLSNSAMLVMLFQMPGDLEAPRTQILHKWEQARRPKKCINNRKQCLRSQ